MVPLKYLQNFWRTLEMPLINCEILTCFGNCVIVYTDAANPGATFAITKKSTLCSCSDFVNSRYAKLL